METSSVGYRNDEGKAPWHLLPTDAMEEIVRVYQFGAKKYGERNYEKGMGFSRPFSSMMRHSWAWWRGEDRDPESGLNHMAHAAVNAMFLLTYALRADLKYFDDREHLSKRDQRAIFDPLKPNSSTESGFAK